MDRKKIAAVAAICVLSGGLGGAAIGAAAFPRTTIEQVVNPADAVMLQDIKDYVSELNSANARIADLEANPIELIKEVETEIEVLVDNGNLELVLDHIYDNDGRLSYITEDLDDDEVDLIVERVLFINDIKALAINEVQKEGLDELDKEVVDGEELDEDEIERFRLYDDDDEIEVDDVDFEDKDGDVYVRARFEQDDIEYEATFKVEFKDGEVDDIDIESVDLRD